VWYGWQILIPGIISDALAIGGFFAGGSGVSVGLLAAAAAGHVFSGPIVHFANGQPLKAGISFLIEGIVPAGVATAGLFSLGHDGTTSTVLLLAAFPITWVAGMVVDTAVLAKKEVKSKPEKGPAISLAPLVVQPLRANTGRSAFSKGWSRETPMGLSLVGQF
jgi:hypothetical protein